MALSAASVLSPTRIGRPLSSAACRGRLALAQGQVGKGRLKCRQQGGERSAATIARICLTTPLRSRGPLLADGAVGHTRQAQPPRTRTAKYERRLARLLCPASRRRLPHHLPSPLLIATATSPGYLQLVLFSCPPISVAFHSWRRFILSSGLSVPQLQRRGAPRKPPGAVLWPMRRKRLQPFVKEAG